MKRILFTLLTTVIALSAVEWEAEQIPTQPGNWCMYSMLEFDHQDNLRIFFIEMDPTGEVTLIKVASKTASSWTIKDVAKVVDPIPIFSMDVNSEGHTFVAYTDFDTTSDLHTLYLASDSNGNFVSKRLTEGNIASLGATIKVDEFDKIHIAYGVLSYETGAVELRYGWFEGSNFKSEAITDDLMYEFALIDMATVNDKPHIFYSDSTAIPCHASKSSEWDTETINDIAGTFPSAETDTQDKLHVTYRTLDLTSVVYVTNSGGTWKDEFVVQKNESQGFGWSVAIALNINGIPSIAWCDYEDNSCYDIYISQKTQSGWEKEPVTDTPEEDEVTWTNHFFRIDDNGYGHITYSSPDSEQTHVYYAKSKAPLAVSESQPGINPNLLEITGTTVHFSLSQAGPIRLALYDASGSRVCCIASGVYATGEHVVPINTSELSAGVYFARIETGRQSASVKFVLTH